VRKSTGERIEILALRVLDHVVPIELSHAQALTQEYPTAKHAWELEVDLVVIA